MPLGWTYLLRIIMFEPVGKYFLYELTYCTIHISRNNFYFLRLNVSCKLRFKILSSNTRGTGRHDWSGLNRIWTHDLCDTSAVLYRLTYQANWELVMLWVGNIPIDYEEKKWIFERPYVWPREKDMQTWFIIAVIIACLSCVYPLTVMINHVVISFLAV